MLPIKPLWLKLIQPIIILIMIGIIAVMASQLGQKKATIKTMETNTAEIARALGVKPYHDAIIAAVDANKQSVINQRMALDRISAEALAAHRRSAALDDELSRTQKANAAKYAAAQATIDVLARRTPTGDMTRDRATINADSKAAWQNWGAK